MRIGLIDVDGHNFPNIALMKLSSWHKAKGDSVEWYSPMFSGRMDRVYMSKVFGFSTDYPYYVNANEIIKGGSGYCININDGKEEYDTAKDKQLPYEIEHSYPDYSIYGITDTAYGYMTRGCPRNCGFCHTTQKDGSISCKTADLDEFWNGQKKIVLLDQNILACKDHLELLDQLIESKAKVEFNGGLDIRLVNDRNIEKIKQLRLTSIHFAFDCYDDKDLIMRNLQLFKDQTGYDKSHGQIMVYVLCNYDTTIEQDIERIQFCRSLKFAPYPMIYDKTHADPIYKRLQRWCNNYIFWKCKEFSDYKGGSKCEN